MRRSIFIIAWLFMIPWVVSAQQELDRYLGIAAENNPGLRANFNEYLAALERAPQLGSLPDPQLAFGYFISPVETRVGPQRFRFSASQMFPWFGTLDARENIATQAAKTTYEAFLESKSKLFHEVRSNYYNLYFNQRAIDITKDNLEILRSLQDLANIKVSAGKVSSVDEYRIEMEIADLENRLALLADNQDVLEVMFINLLHTDKELDIILPEILWTTDIDLTKEQALDSMRSNNHQLLSISLENQVLDYRKELAEKSGMPDFSVGFDYIMVGTGENNLAGTDAVLFPKIGIRIPLYRNKYKAMVNEVMFLKEAKTSEETEQINFLETVLERNWKDYLDADRRIRLYLSQRDLAKKAVKLLETEYASGNKNFEEILRMERKLLIYGLELERARSDKQASISFISYITGQ